MDTGHAAFVRLAYPAEAGQIAAVQRRRWLTTDAGRAMAEAIDLATAEEAWQQAIVRPPLAHHRVLVATEPQGPAEPLPDGENGTRRRVRVVGFAALGPSDDPDADASDSLLSEFVVDDTVHGTGHDDRLMHAVVDTARADGYDRLTVWVDSTDDRMRAWLSEAGWAADGAHREFGSEDGSVRVKQVRLHTAMS